MQPQPGLRQPWLRKRQLLLIFKVMKFFDRIKEIESLRKIREGSLKAARFTVVAGRRRIGKTSLILEAYRDDLLLYFFVGRKAENILCQEFREETESKLNVRLGGRPSDFAELFEYLMQLSVEKPFTLFIDEFQNFDRVNPSVFSDMQRIWDLYHNQSRINLVVCGSVYSMMTHIFRDKKEPLYNRESNFITVRPFQPSVMKEILECYRPGYTKEDLLALFSFTGGVAKYIQLLVENDALSLDEMIDCIVGEDSVFIGEGKALLIEEFGRDYNTYFSILSTIASGYTRRNEIEGVIGKAVGGYLTRLEEDYGLIKREMPVGAKPMSKNVVYSIRDNFLTFWFRFIFKYDNIIEIGAYNQLREILRRDYPTFSGKMLERYFIAKAIESHKYTLIGQWWDRKGENEIDLIAANMLEKSVDVYEIKRKGRNASLRVLEEKAKTMLARTDCFNGYTLDCRILDMSDM